MVMPEGAERSLRKAQADGSRAKPGAVQDSDGTSSWGHRWFVCPLLPKTVFNIPFSSRDQFLDSAVSHVIWGLHPVFSENPSEDFCSVYICFFCPHSQLEVYKVAFCVEATVAVGTSFMGRSVVPPLPSKFLNGLHAGGMDAAVPTHPHPVDGAA